MPSGNNPLFNPADWVYTFTLMDLTIGEFQYPVASAKIDLPMNDIPSIVLQIDPRRVPAGHDIRNVPDTDILPQGPSLSSLIETHSALQALVNDEKTIVKFRIRLEAKQDFQEINIQNWVLASVGIRGEQSGGTYSLEVTIKHPAYRSTRATTAMFNQLNSVDAPDDISGNNILEIYIDSVTKWVKQSEDGVDTGIAAGLAEEADEVTQATTSAGRDSLKKVSTVLAKQIRAAVENLKSTVEYNAAGGKKLPFSSGSGISGDAVGQAAVTAVDRYIRDTLWPYIGYSDSTVWAVLVQTEQGIAVDYSLVVHGTPTDAPLIISPYAPWGKASGVLFDDEIFDLRMDPTESRPAAGILVTYDSALGTDGYGMYIPIGSSDEGTSLDLLTSAGGYLRPLEDADPAAALIGEVKVETPPAYISEFFNYQAAADRGEEGEEGGTGTETPPLDRDGVNVQDDFDVNDGTGSTDRLIESLAPYRALVDVWSKQRFFESYRSEVGVSFGTRLMLQNDSQDLPNGYLRPGVTLEVRSRETGQTALFFYVTEVVHVLDGQNKQAYTNIMGSYLRPPEAIKQAKITKEEIIAGINNPIYQSRGVLDQEAEVL